MARIPADSEDMYSDAAPSAAPDKATEDSKGGTQSTTIPKSLLAGKEFKVGDSLILKIDAIHDKELVVSYDYEAPEANEEGEFEPDEEAQPEEESPLISANAPEAESEMEGMMS